MRSRVAVIAVLSLAVASVGGAGTVQMAEISLSNAKEHLVKRQQRSYPAIAKAGPLQGTVVLKATISKEGNRCR